MTDCSGLSRDDLVARLRAAEATLECYTDLITEYKQMEETLQKREQELSAVFRAVPAGVGLVVQRVFRQANDYFYRMLGYRSDELIGQSTRIVYPSDEAFERIDREIQDQIERTGLAVLETETRCKDGRLIDVLLRVAPLVSNRPELGRVFCALDITEKKRSEAEHLARLERQRDTLIREVHHRIKNHLQGVTGLLRNRIARHPELTEDLEDLATQICAIAHVYGLQSYSIAGRVRLADLLETLACAATGPIPIRFSPAPEFGAVAVLAPDEAVPLALVFNELLTNALKHNDPSGASRPVRLALETNGEERRVAIRNGPAFLPAAFDFSAGWGLGTGLELLRTLLPTQSSALTFRQEADEVLVELRLTPPVIRFVEADIDRFYAKS